MIGIIAVYWFAVLAKWAWEMFGWVDKNRAAGMRGWWVDNRFRVYRKTIVHVPLCALWSLGLMLQAVNAGLATLNIDPLAAVTWQSTLAAGFMLDTIGKPLVEKFLMPGEQ